MKNRQNHTYLAICKECLGVELPTPYEKARKLFLNCSKCGKNKEISDMVLTKLMDSIDKLDMEELVKAVKSQYETNRVKHNNNKK